MPGILRSTGLLENPCYTSLLFLFLLLLLGPCCKELNISGYLV